jgi:hypothetical protein
MDDLEFDTHVGKIAAVILDAVDNYLTSQGMSFNPLAFLEEQSTDFTDTVKDMLFHGAEVYPLS